MSVPIIALRTSARDYSGLVTLANRAVADLTGNATYPTPIPALAAVTTASDAVALAIAQWGDINNRGSRADLSDLKAKSVTLHQLLKALSQYVENTAALSAGSDFTLMANLIATSGFGLRNPKTPQGTLEMVQGFHHFVSRRLNSNQVKLKWLKPNNVTSAGNVKSYKVYRGTTPVFVNAELVSTTTRTTFIDVNDAAGPVTWTYFIVPVNNAGDGTISDAVTITVLGTN